MYMYPKKSLGPTSVHSYLIMISYIIINHTEFIHSLWHVIMHKINYMHACSLESVYMDFLQREPHYYYCILGELGFYRHKDVSKIIVFINPRRKA